MARYEEPQPGSVLKAQGDTGRTDNKGTAVTKLPWTNCAEIPPRDEGSGSDVAYTAVVKFAPIPCTWNVTI